MGDIDTQELKVRLGYWIHHNREHGDEFREWAGKAGEAGMDSVETRLTQASDLMAEATAALESALKALQPE
jgi:hypothetical protein